jgi:hypothetical protein
MVGLLDQECKVKFKVTFSRVLCLGASDDGAGGAGDRR